MNEEELTKLNKYLNELFIYLDNNFESFLNYLVEIFSLSDEYYTLLRDYDFERCSIENHLTYNDIFEIAKEIIASIDKEYLKDFDNLINSGVLDFSYDNEYDDSHYCYDLNHSEININRDFNYDDVVTLIHEFFHYLNGKSINDSENRYLLTEFISIYFEFYAVDYLVKKGIPNNEMDSKIRLISTFFRSRDIYNLEIPLLAYLFFGKIDSDSCRLLNYFKIIKVDGNTFYNDCKVLYDKLNEREKKYRLDFFKHQYNDNILRQYYGDLFCDYFKYFVGTLLALYSRNNCNLADIVYINNHINDENFSLIDIFKILKLDTILDLEEIMIESVKKYLDDYHIEKEGEKCKKNILVKE